MGMCGPKRDHNTEVVHPCGEAYVSSGSDQEFFCFAQDRAILPVCFVRMELVLICLPDDMAHVPLNPIMSNIEAFACQLLKHLTGMLGPLRGGSCHCVPLMRLFTHCAL